MRSAHAQEWKQAMESKLHSLAEHQVAETVDKDIPSYKVIGARRVFAVKPDGRLKVGIVA